MSWEIELYESTSGNQPVARFIAGLKPEEQAKIARSFDLLEEFGPEVGVPYVKHLSGTGGLWNCAFRSAASRSGYCFLFTSILWLWYTLSLKNLLKYR